MSEDLNPCRCGDTPIYTGGEFTGYEVICMSCRRKGAWGDYAYQAKDSWNGENPMTQSIHEKSMHDILTKLRDHANTDPATLYAQIEKLHTLLADAVSNIGKTSDEPGCCCPDADDLRPDCPIHGTEVLATSRGFTYWPGGDAAPDDFDPDQTILFRCGDEFTPYGDGEGFNWSHNFSGNGPTDGDIIGYHRKAEAAGQIEQAIEDAIKDGAIDLDDAITAGILAQDRRMRRDAFAMAAAPFILGKFFGAVDYGDLVVHLFDFADSCLAESEKRAKGDAA